MLRGALAEPPLQRLAEHFFPPSTAQKQWVGADPSGCSDSMPPAELVLAATEALPLFVSKANIIAAQQFSHAALGAGLGAAYGTLALERPAATRGEGRA